MDRIDSEDFNFLASPVRVDEQHWPEGTVPLVSICCITYNHEKFICECLEGFLMQETTFPVEILIHEDASSDKNADIIREYRELYPKIIKPIFQSENQYKKKIKPNVKYNYPRALGKYIALCEGDDYWTDPLKIQSQFNLMEEEEGCSLCFHNSTFGVVSKVAETEIYRE